MNLVDEEDAGDELGDSGVDVPVHHLVDLLPQLLGDLRLLRLHHGAHHAHDVLATLGFGVCRVEVVQGHVLDDLLLLVNVTLEQQDVLLGLEVELGGVGVASPPRLTEPELASM